MKNELVAKLLATAVALLDTHNDNVELKDSIEALQFLGDEANGNSQEYKDLKGLVKTLQDTQKPTQDKSTQKKDDVEDTQKPTHKKRLNYAGVKQIGGLWYCSKDNYKKQFATADECAIHFNSKD